MTNAPHNHNVYGRSESDGRGFTKEGGILSERPGWIFSVVRPGGNLFRGLGICLIFSVGAPFAAEGSAALKLVMGVSFGVALTLVIFAGSELFTGNNMVCTIGDLSRAIT